MNESNIEVRAVPAEEPVVFDASEAPLLLYGRLPDHRVGWVLFYALDSYRPDPTWTHNEFADTGMGAEFIGGSPGDMGSALSHAKQWLEAHKHFPSAAGNDA